MNKISLCLITLCYNEMEVMAFVLDYWMRLRYQLKENMKVVVYDNYSTDGSDTYLQCYDWIEVRKFNSNGKHNDVIHQQVKHDAWREFKGKYDFICICDFDEVLWNKDNDILEELQYMKDNGYNVLGTEWIAFCGNEKPRYTSIKYLHQLVKRGYHQYINHTKGYANLGKFLLFDSSVQDIQWSVGQHILFDVKPTFKLYKSDKIITFHINKGFGEDYFVQKRHKMGARLSETNKRYGMAVEYNYPEYKIREEYRSYQKESFDISNL